MSIQLTDTDVQNLINLTKTLLRKHDINLSTDSRGILPIASTVSPDQFCLDYFIRPGRASLNFRELTYNYSIVRINLNESFHKNADNTIVEGNRLNLFSTDEYHAKGDSKTYMKAFPLPHLEFLNYPDIGMHLLELLDYTNTDYNNKLTVNKNDFGEEDYNAPSRD